MNVQSFFTIIKQSFLEGDKGSGKAFASFFTMLVIGFLCVWPTIHDKPIDVTTLLELLGFVAALYGIKGYVSVKKQSDNQKQQ